MSRKPIFSQEGKPQAPNASQTNFQKDTRLSQTLRQSQIVQQPGLEKSAPPVSGTTSGFNSTSYSSNNREDPIMQMSQISQRQSQYLNPNIEALWQMRIPSTKWLKTFLKKKLTVPIMEGKGYSVYRFTQQDELIKRDINILAQYVKENQKQIEMLRAVYFEQKNQQQQSMAQGVPEKLFKQIQSFEESFGAKITSVQDQLVQHQEVFQNNYSQRFQELRNQIDQLKGNLAVNDNKLNKCIQFCAKIEVPEDFIGQTNAKFLQFETAVSLQMKQTQTTSQNYIQVTIKKMMDQIEHQFNEINLALSSRPLMKSEGSHSSLTESQLNSINSEIQSLRKRYQDIGDRQAGAQAFMNEVNSNLEKLRFEFLGTKEDQSTFKRETKEALTRNQRALEEFRVHVMQENSKSQDQLQGIALSLQSNIENLNNALELRLKSIEKAHFMGKKNEVLFSFNQKFDGDSKYQSKEITSPNSYTILSEKLYDDSCVPRTRLTQPENLAFQSVEVETFEYADNKFIEDDDGDRVKTESDVVEIGTTKGDNKESFLERISEMRRLPDISERLEECDSIEFPTQQVSIQEPFVPQTNKMLTDSEFNTKTNNLGTDESRIINEDEDEEEEVTYQLDDNGYLMDETGAYILDDDGNMIQLENEQIAYLKEKQMIQEDDE